MKIKIRKNKSVKISAQNELDSLYMLEFLESMAGEEKNPERKSIKKRQELIERGLIK